ncbi:MAG: arsenate reductase [Gammaproteobacteria bacterium]|nr:arsenate reductase [Gammaproteobacteria bacterium]
MPVTLFGIPNCDRCRNARKWLEQQSVAYTFHDLRRDGVDLRMLQRWSAQLPWTDLLNNRSRTWRELPPAARQDIDEQRALQLMLEHPTLLRRPLFETRDKVSVGFDASRKREILDQIK